MIPSTLVKYENPIQYSEITKKRKTALRKGKTSNTLPPVEGKGSFTQTEDLLNNILPPREFKQDDAHWVQYVSSTPATRLDVINLQEQLDQQLKQRQARDTGICPVREELFGQCFDEIIRQVTINCAERGLLLLRVRNEAKMTVNAYRTLYESSVAFGLRKALQAEEGKADMRKEIDQLKEENSNYQRQVQELSAKCDAAEKKEKEKRLAEEKKYEERINFLEKENAQYKQELERLMTPKK
eukprot:gb/GECH01013039.1/.p1 GENE.gb/GECH01013039.1/~~gb/GECH01013039.1/.p1  ORF type:complete len:241 (+),score=80.23 gb/GECH01013039.1/:1-723(+)